MRHGRPWIRLALASFAITLFAPHAGAQEDAVPLAAIERETVARVAAGATSVVWICAPAADGVVGCSAREDAGAVRFGDGQYGARLPAGGRAQPSQQRVLVAAPSDADLTEIGRALAADPASREALARWRGIVETELRAGRDPARLVPRILEEARLRSPGEDAQLANMDLQDSLQKRQQALQTLSHVSKSLHDTAMAVIRKIGG
ncbi:MAG TPA: hypothetical protein VMR66_08020 [Gemmatimonadota bacterium]|nr:hypothetical protein [Gemmatimonadota bacterium]